MSKERFDIHQHITDKIVSAIQRGAGDFRLPWYRAAGGIMRPVNVASQKQYRGINVVALWAYAEEFGYSSGVWGTYRQWAEAGAQVRKGEKAAFVVFYKELEVAAETDTGDAETTTRLFARATPVFAAEQVDGFSFPALPEKPANPVEPIEAAEALSPRPERTSCMVAAGLATCRAPTTSTCLHAMSLSAPGPAPQPRPITRPSFTS